MVMGPQAKTTPDGLEPAAEAARVAREAQHELYLAVKRLLERPDHADIHAWATSLTSTNCDWRLYDVGQQILHDYPYVHPAYRLRPADEAP